MNAEDRSPHLKVQAIPQSAGPQSHGGPADCEGRLLNALESCAVKETRIVGLRVSILNDAGFAEGQVCEIEGRNGKLGRPEWRSARK